MAASTSSGEAEVTLQQLTSGTVISDTRHFQDMPGEFLTSGRIGDDNSGQVYALGPCRLDLKH